MKTSYKAYNLFNNETKSEYNGRPHIRRYKRHINPVQVASESVKRFHICVITIRYIEMHSGRNGQLLKYTWRPAALFRRDPKFYDVVRTKLCMMTTNTETVYYFLSDFNLCSHHLSRLIKNR